MYNGIGLKTARGSGTNGYVTKNFAYVKETTRKPYGPPSFDHISKPEIKKANSQILMHEQKKKIESQLFDMRTRLEEKGSYTPEQIDEMIAKERKELYKEMEHNQHKSQSRFGYAKKLAEQDREYYQHDKSGVETHEHVQARNRKNQILAQALGIDAESHVEGAAFNKELQEKKKQERISKREAMMKERMEAKKDNQGSPVAKRSPSPTKSPSTEKRKRKRSYSESSSDDDSEDGKKRSKRKRRRSSSQ